MVPQKLTNREVKQFVPNVPKDDAKNKRRLYALQTRGENLDDDDNE